MFRKVTNIVMVGLIAVFLCGLAGLKIASEAGVPFPEESGIGQEQSALEGRDYYGPPIPTLKNVARGSFQTDCEKYLADLTPMRDRVILTNAALQRVIIEIGNMPFGWECYPTFFESRYCVFPEGETVFEGPMSKPETFWESAQNLTEGFSHIVEKNPEINWVFYLCDQATSSSASPAMQYYSNACDLSYFEDHIRPLLPDNCAFISGEYSNLDDLLNDFMATDHHWNVRGATKAYQEIEAKLGKAPIGFSYYEAFDGPCYGSAARNGLCLKYPEPMIDVEYKRSNLRVTVNDAEANEAFLDEGYGEGETALTAVDKTLNSYASWFHSITPFFTITNDSVQEGTLLLLNDSFGNSMQRFFAEHYHVVYVIDPRQYDGSLEEFLATHDIDDAVFLTSIGMFFEDIKTQFD